MNSIAVLTTHIVLVAFLLNHCAAANQAWLSILSFDCNHSATSCIGIVLDNHWVLTTASCFQKCDVKVPLQLNAFVDIPNEALKAMRTAMRMGSEVSATLVWQHPEFSADTGVNNLALVKLGCHDHALENLNLASNCSTHDSPDAYVFAKTKVIRFRNSVRRIKCFSRIGSGTWYYRSNTLQVVATSHDSSNCMVTLLCKHAEQLTSFMQGL